MVSNNTAYFHRDYENDLPKNVKSEKNSKFLKYTAAALPYLALYRPLGRTLASCLSVTRTFTSISQCHSAKSTGELSWALFQTAMAVASVAGTIFLHPVGMIITTISDIGTNTLDIYTSLKRGEMLTAAKHTLHVANNSFYLAMMLIGSIELQLASLAVQVIIEGASTYTELDQGNALEAISHFGMCLIRMNQGYAQWKVIEQKRALESLLVSAIQSSTTGDLIVQSEAEPLLSSPQAISILSTGSVEGITVNSVPPQHVTVHAYTKQKFNDTIPFSDLENFPQVTHVNLVGLNYKKETTDYASFEKLCKLPHLQSLSLYSGDEVHSWLGHTGFQPQISREQFDVIKSLPIQTLSLYLYELEGIPLNELKEMDHLEKLKIHFPKHGWKPITYLDSVFDQLNKLSDIALELRGALPYTEILNRLESIKDLTVYSALDIDIMNLKVRLPNLRRLIMEDNYLKGLRVDLFAPNLEFLSLMNSSFTGSTVNFLKSMKNLREVLLGHWIYGSPYVNGSLGSGAVKNLSKVAGLKILNLSAQPIKGADFSGFTDLEFLDLSGTNITCVDLLTLYGLDNLRELRLQDLRGTTIGDKEIEALCKALPNCKIIR